MPSSNDSIDSLLSQAFSLDNHERQNLIRSLQPDLAARLKKLLAASEQIDDRSFLRRSLGQPDATVEGIQMADNPSIPWLDSMETFDGKDPPPGIDVTIDAPFGDSAQNVPDLAAGKQAAPAGEIKQSRVIGRYKLLQPLGVGGMGEVWMAQQSIPVRRNVALKLIKSGINSDQVIARFEAERQALAMMDHHNIARVLDAGQTDDGLPYFVMELVQGVPITEYCDNNELSIDERLELFIQVCNAVQHAHQKGIIHRDLKPSNVLVCQYDGVSVPKVIDFGLAKAIEIQTHLTDKTMFTQFGQVVGTLQYMSPEQAEMNELGVDTRTDIYSLGVMLYELLTGSTPIQRDTLRQLAMMKVLQSIRETEPPLPSSRLSSSADVIEGISRQRKIDPRALQRILKGDLDWIVMKSLDKDRDRRYATASDFAQDVERYIQCSPVEAHPPSLGYRLRRGFRRHRAAYLSTAAIALLLFAGLASTSFLYVRASDAEADARRSEARAIAAAAKESEEKERAVAASRAARAAETRALSAQEVANKSKLATEKTLSQSNYLLANARWNAGESAEAIDALMQVPVEHRNLEWRLSLRQFIGSDLTMYGHLGAVSEIVYSPNGDQIFSAGDDNTIRIWDAASGAELQTLTRHNAPLSSLAISDDATRLASGADGSVVIWDIQTTQIQRHCELALWMVAGLKFSGDGRSLAIWGYQRSKQTNWQRRPRLELWDPETGQQLLQLSGAKGHWQYVNFDPSGKAITGVDSTGTITTFDTKSGKILNTLELTIGEIDSFDDSAISPDGRLVAGIHSGGVVEIWQIETARRVEAFEVRECAPTNLQFSPDGTQLAAGCVNDDVLVWDMTSGQLEHRNGGHFSPVGCLCFSPGGHRLASGSADSTIKVWNADAPSARTVLPGEGMSGNQTVMDRDGKQLAIAGLDGKINLWDVETWRFMGPLAGHAAGVRCLTFNPDATSLISGGEDGVLIIWGLTNGTVKKKIEVSDQSITSLSLSSDGRWLACSAGLSLSLIELPSGREVWRREDDDSYRSALAFSPDEPKFVSGDLSGKIEVWGLDSNKPLLTLQNDSFIVRDLKVSRDGRTIASSHFDSSVRLWSMKTGASLARFSGLLGYLEFTPDSTRLLGVGSNDLLKVWDIIQMREVKSLALGGVSPNSIALSHDATRVVIGGRRSVHVWDVSSLWESKQLGRHFGEVYRTGYNSNDDKIYSQSTDGRVISWGLDGTQSEAEVDIGTMRRLSDDNRWLAIQSDNWIQAIDLEYKSQTSEVLVRQFKHKVPINSHLEKAASYRTAENHFAATFHLAWQLAGTPASSAKYLDLRNELRQSYRELGDSEREIAKTLIRKRLSSRANTAPASHSQKFEVITEEKNGDRVVRFPSLRSQADHRVIKHRAVIEGAEARLRKFESAPGVSYTDFYGVLVPSSFEFAQPHAIWTPVVEKRTVRIPRGVEISEWIRLDKE